MNAALLLAVTSVLFLCTDGLLEADYEDYDVNISAILSQMTIGYDKRVRPHYGGSPVTVGVSLYVLSISEFSAKTMDFTFDMYFRQFWHDPRLAFQRRPGLSKLVLGAEFAKSIWVPDTFFVNEKESRQHHDTVDNQFLRILHSGEILRSMRITVKASCPLDLQYFPMDKQLCSLDIESFGYTMSDVRYRWNDGLNSVQLSPDMSLPEFKVLGHRQKLIEVSLSSGNYSRLLADVLFVRSVGPYVIQVYLPLVLLVIMSWLSFWLSPAEVSARVGICVLSALAITLIILSVNSDLPRISYFKAIDVYMLACFFFVLAGLMESVSVAFTATWVQELLAEQEMKNEDSKEEVKKGGVRVLCGFKPKYLDWLSRLGFPLVFFCFNLVYWATYNGMSKESVQDLVYLH